MNDPFATNIGLLVFLNINHFKPSGNHTVKFNTKISVLTLHSVLRRYIRFSKHTARPVTSLYNINGLVCVVRTYWIVREVWNELLRLM